MGEYNLTFAEASMLSKILKTAWSGRKWMKKYH
jgi:hypothetical protein